jgi:hypothetical protein
MIPHSIAIASAVSALSPVTILTLIPAVWQVLTDAGTVFLRLSLIPVTHKRVNPFSSTG